MAKVKEAMNGKSRDAASDLLGVSKPRGAKGAVLQKNARGAVMKTKVEQKEPRERKARAMFEDGQRIRKVGDRNTRPDSNVGRAIALLKPNMTFGEFKKAMAKSGNPLPPAGILGFLQNDGVVQVK